MHCRCFLCYNSSSKELVADHLHIIMCFLQWLCPDHVGHGRVCWHIQSADISHVAFPLRMRLVVVILNFWKTWGDLSWTRIRIQVITHWNSIATYMYNNGSAGWECLAKIFASVDLTNGMVCDIGLPVEQHGFRYNCRVYGLNSQILLIRPT
jgi:hypothetical protein